MSTIAQTTRPLIAYYRVSTPRQGMTGLGMDAQKVAVVLYARMTGQEVLCSYAEVETGKRAKKRVDLDTPIRALMANRPQLLAAVDHALRIDGLLVIGVLDRLARDVAVTSCLRMSGVKFIACDNPHATPLTIDILAAVAEDESRRISERTTRALAAAKSRGVRLGGFRRAEGVWTDGPRKGQHFGRSHTFTAENRALSARTRAASAASNRAKKYSSCLPIMHGRRDAGESYRQIAAALNEMKLTTAKGSPWTPGTVRRILTLTLPEWKASNETTVIATTLT